MAAPVQLVQQTTSKSFDSANEDGDDSSNELEAKASREDEECLLEQQPGVVTRKGPRSRSFRRICCLILIGLAVIFVLSFILEIAITLSFVLTSKNESPTSSSSQNLLTLQDVFDPSLQTKTYQGTWVKGGEIGGGDSQILHLSSTDGVTLFSPSENVTRTLLDKETVADLKISSVKLSPSGRYLLLIGDIKKVYRHSFIGKYYIHAFEPQENTCTWLLDIDVQYAQWSPFNDDVLVYVKDYNIIFYNAINSLYQQHTFDGEENQIYNGIPDWVYEEEVFSTNYAIWWAPDGQHTLYCTFNDTLVEQFQFPEYGPRTDEYTQIESISYPKAGSTNPYVKVWVVGASNIGKNESLELPPPNEFQNIDHYVLWGAWLNPSVAGVSWSNRRQDRVIHCLYNVNDTVTECNQVYTQVSDAWVEVVEPPVYTSNHMFIIDSVLVGSGDKFLHVVQVDLQTGNSNPLTTGEWEVTHIIGATDNDLLYISTKTNPWQRHIYNLVGECLTCDETEWTGSCQYWSGSCSDSLEYCMLQCSGPDIPFTITLKYEGGGFVPVVYLERNELLRESIASFDLPTVEVVTIPSNEPDEPSLYARVMYPPGSTRECDKTHPVLFYVYGGPYSQMIGEVAVTSRLFIAYLASEFDMMVVSVDGRGTGFRGDSFKHSVYRQLGQLETVDQLRGARFFQEKCYVDSSHFAIYGSSYGGYMAGMIESSGTGVFTAAISQSPVSDWHYYDSIYTERYMNLPTDNSDGYRVTSLLNRLSNVSVESLPHYLLIHGTGDDNVHFQNTAQLISVLTEREIQYQLMVGWCTCNYAKS
ncbi:PREDICTED: prolyl endopeptidase FAP-like [Amphimedon queenslandica]|uniref:Uncharacterized protein n=1 Tax=Amphimedon queenslandica TaxID=400682 RepID=A0A1X7V316_AMPQE|nr:PREDICTED: prolyl endopeptidase FAP-like [Amphimedon queenslandica]|eukprot:XP_019850892.1 PREDICTED: prolyl endopeptidase FAP-like [Amphimedon queenslandica]